LSLASEDTRVRVCVGCGKSVTKRELLRFRVPVAPAKHPVAPKQAVGVEHAAGPSNRGRSAYAHATPKCLSQALRTGFARSFKRAIVTQPEIFTAALVDSLQQTLAMREHAAKRQRMTSFGMDVLRVHAELAGIQAFALGKTTRSEVR
jgi:predicted RNA-binding protein YlxR (DUF448 family)